MPARVDDTPALQTPRVSTRQTILVLGDTLFVTGTVVGLLCGAPTHPLRSWQQIALAVLVCTLLTFAVHAAVVWSSCKFHGVSDLVGPLVVRLWPWVAWVPLLALLTGERSIWVALILPAMAASATVYIRRRELPGDQDPRARQDFLQPPRTIPFPLLLLPALATSLLLQAGAVMLLTRTDWPAGLLLACAAILPAWRLTRSNPERKQTAPAWRRAAANSAIVFPLTIFCLIPYMQGGSRESSEIDILLARASHAPVPPIVHAHALTTGAGFSGIILLLPSKPHAHTLPPPVQPAPPRPGTPSEPVVIPFDGAYWYLKQPEDRPEPDARIVHGDPLKATFHSTNSLPVLMKAHQLLPAPVKLSCCTALRTELVNADTRPGTIIVEIAVSDTHHPNLPPTSLGRLMLPSSQSSIIASDRPPVHETLTFNFPHARTGQQFNEITVNILRGGEKALTATRVSVQNFTLVP